MEACGLFWRGLAALHHHGTRVGAPHQPFVCGLVGLGFPVFRREAGNYSQIIKRNRVPFIDFETGFPKGAPVPRTVVGAFTLAKQQKLEKLLEGNPQETFKGRVIPALSTVKVKHSGRNDSGRITVRHRGGGAKQRLRFVDFKRGRRDIPATVLRIEHAPDRSSHVALIQYEDGVLSYIIAPLTLRPGDEVISSEHANVLPGNCLPLKSIPVGLKLPASDPICLRRWLCNPSVMMRVLAFVLIVAGAAGQVAVEHFESDIPACAGTTCPALECQPPFVFRNGAEAGTCCGMCWSDDVHVPEDREWTKGLTGGVGMDNNADPGRCRGVMCPALACEQTQQEFSGNCCTKCKKA